MKFDVEVTRTSTVEVEIDEDEFDEKFMEEFRSYMYDFDTIEDHVRHLAQLAARESASGFVEGYGHINGSKSEGEPTMNIKTRVMDVETDCVIWK